MDVHINRIEDLKADLSKVAFSCLNISRIKSIAMCERCDVCCGTFDGDTGGDGGLPLPMATPGHPNLVGDVVAGLTEQVDAALLGETPARRRFAAEAAMFWHQRVSAVAQSACAEETDAAMKTIEKVQVMMVITYPSV